MKKEFNEVTTEHAFAMFLATYYAQLMTIHPFREGNGRSCREFLREFVYAYSSKLPCGQLELDWSKFDGDLMLRDIQFSLVFRGVIEHEFQKALVPVDLDDQIKM